jgi:transketolase
MQAQRLLEQENINVRVVSMPSMELFNQQPQSYRDSVLLPDVKTRVAVEAGIADSWLPYLHGGQFVGVGRRFGASAPYEVLYEKYGITAKAVVTAVKSQLDQ